MIVLVLTALLDKGNLIDARILKAPEMRTQLLGRANAARRTASGSLARAFSYAAQISV
jgi:hypothetical protein